MNTHWTYYPRSDEPSDFIRRLVQVFTSRDDELSVLSKELTSDGILAILRRDLQELGFQVETGKRKHEKIYVPVLFGQNGTVEKAFEADAWHKSERLVLEVEAGRGYLNNQFLKDLFQACMMHDIDYCAIAVRNKYITSNDYRNVISFFETLYASRRLVLPLKGVLVIGYGHTEY